MLITESFAMWPGSSVSGLYFAHPESRYFNLGKIDRDQVGRLSPTEGHERRRGRAVAGSEPELRSCGLAEDKMSASLDLNFAIRAPGFSRTLDAVQSCRRSHGNWQHSLYLRASRQSSGCQNSRPKFLSGLNCRDCRNQESIIGQGLGILADLVEPRTEGYGYQVRPGRIDSVVEALHKSTGELTSANAAGFHAFEDAIGGATVPPRWR